MKPIRVTPYSSARAMERLDGAPIAATIGIPAFTAFCTNSKLILPLSIKILSVAGNLFFTNKLPISLSRALCRPTSSLCRISSPIELKRPHACRPPVCLNTSCADSNACGSCKIVFIDALSSVSGRGLQVCYT
jgi:hypothetical protein